MRTRLGTTLSALLERARVDIAASPITVLAAAGLSEAALSDAATITPAVRPGGGDQ